MPTVLDSSRVRRSWFINSTRHSLILTSLLLHLKLDQRLISGAKKEHQTSRLFYGLSVRWDGIVPWLIAGPAAGSWIDGSRGLIVIDPPPVFALGFNPFPGVAGEPFLAAFFLGHFLLSALRGVFPLELTLVSGAGHLGTLYKWSQRCLSGRPASFPMRLFPFPVPDLVTELAAGLNSPWPL